MNLPSKEKLDQSNNHEDKRLSGGGFRLVQVSGHCCIQDVVIVRGSLQVTVDLDASHFLAVADNLHTDIVGDLVDSAHVVLPGVIRAAVPCTLHVSGVCGCHVGLDHILLGIDDLFFSHPSPLVLRLLYLLHSTASAGRVIILSLCAIILHFKGDSG